MGGAQFFAIVFAGAGALARRISVIIGFYFDALVQTREVFQ